MASDDERIARFEILRELTQGGMAELLLCRERRGEGLKQERLVVVKRILRHLRDQPEIVEMFRHEKAIAIGLRHPNLVESFESGRANDGEYLAMEYVDGLDLSDLVEALRRRGRRLGLGEAIEIVRGICEALDYLHELRDGDGSWIEVVHRDVCPHNVLISSAGVVKLLDFGIATSRHRAAVPVAGTMKGRATYMAPEQLRGEPVDRRADVFAASVVLWELTTGQRLYLRANQMASIRAIVDEPALAPSKVVPDYPPDLEAIVLAGLERDRARRIPTTRLLASHLDAFIRDAGLEASPERLGDLVRHLLGRATGP